MLVCTGFFFKPKSVNALHSVMLTAIYGKWVKGAIFSWNSKKVSLHFALYHIAQNGRNLDTSDHLLVKHFCSDAALVKENCFVYSTVCSFCPLIKSYNGFSKFLSEEESCEICQKGDIGVFYSRYAKLLVHHWHIIIVVGSDLNFGIKLWIEIL